MTKRQAWWLIVGLLTFIAAVSATALGLIALVVAWKMVCSGPLSLEQIAVTIIVVTVLLPGLTQPAKILWEQVGWDE